MGLFLVRFGQLRRSPASSASCACCRKPGIRSVSNQRNLELGERRKDVEHELAAGRRRVDHRLSEAAELDATLLENLHGLDELLNRSRQAIQSPDHQRVAVSHIFQCSRELRPIALDTRFFLLEDSLASSRGKSIALE